MDAFRVDVQTADFNPGAEIAALGGTHGEIGAVASFVGLVRADAQEGEHADDALQALTLEHYPGMTEQALADIVATARTRWRCDAIRVIHRYGRLAVGARIVFVGVASGHRGDAFEACAFIMDYLKTQAPFWKREERTSGQRWVEARASDDEAAARWQA